MLLVSISFAAHAADDGTADASAPTEVDVPDAETLRQVICETAQLAAQGDNTSPTVTEKEPAGSGGQAAALLAQKTGETENQRRQYERLVRERGERRLRRAEIERQQERFFGPRFYDFGLTRCRRYPYGGYYSSDDDDPSLY